MALRFQDPLSTWGSGATSRTNMVLSEKGWLNVPSGWSCENDNTSAPGGWALRSLSNASNSSNLRLSLGGALQTSGLAVRLWVSSIPATPQYLFWYKDNAGTLQFVVIIDPDGSVRLGNGSGTTLGSTSAGRVTPGVFTHFEFKLKIAASPGGEFELRINKSVALTVTGVQTKNSSGSNDAAYVEFFPGFNTNTLMGNVYVATPIIWDTTGSFCNDFLGPKVPYLVQLTSDGTTTEWDIIGDAGTSFGSVNSIPQGGASKYLEATTDGDLTLMNFESKNLSNVVAVTIQHTDRLATAGSSTATVSLTNGVNETAGTDRNPAYPAWTAYQDHFYQDPGGSTLTAALAAGSLGVKLERTS